LTRDAWGLLAASGVSVGLLFWLLLRWRQVVRTGRRASDDPAFAPLQTEARRLGNIRSRVRVKITRDTMSPAVCGLFRPVILLPQALTEKLAPEQLRAVLLHELMHLRRGDVWVNFAQALIQIIYWWHPLVWLANARIRRVREEAVDDAVMVALRDEAEIYAPTLLAVAKFAWQRPLISLGLVGILESRSALRQRIERLVNFPVPRKAGLSLLSAFGILAFSAVALPMGDAPPPPLLPTPEPIPQTDEKMRWPDPRYDGYQHVNLRADFLILDKSQLQSSVTALAKTTAPVVIPAEEIDGVVTQLKRAGARFFNDYREGIAVPGISGTRQHYVIGGIPDAAGSAEFVNTNIAGTTMLAGTEIRMPASQADWTPMDFTVHPWQQAAATRCQLELTVWGQSQDIPASDVVIPAGGAMAWVTTPPTHPGKCQVILLMSWDATNHSAMAFQNRRIQFGPTAFSLIMEMEPRPWLPRAIWKDEISYGSCDASITKLVHDAGLNWLPPRSFTFNFDTSLDVYAPARDVAAIESLLGKINQLTNHWSASLTTTGRDSVIIKDEIQAGKLLYEMGELDAAERDFEGALTQDPVNATPHYYLNLIHQAQLTGAARTTSAPPVKSSLVNTFLIPGEPRLETWMLSKKSGLPKFRAQTGLTATSPPDEYLAGFARLLANFGAALPTNSLWFGDQGLLLVRGTPAELAAVKQLFEDLNGSPRAAVKSQGNAKFVAIANQTASPAAADLKLYMRTFKVNPQLFPESVQKTTESRPPLRPEQLGDSLRALFGRMGVNLDAPKAMFYNNRLGMLFVKATSGDLDVIERVVGDLNQIPAPQLHIKTRFIEVTGDLKDIPTLTNYLNGQTLTGIMGAEQTRTFLRQIETQPGTENLPEPEVTTTSGRQTQMRATDLETVMVGINAQALTPPGVNSITNLFHTEVLECGPSCDVVPYVLADGYTINLTMIPSFTRFTGYATPTNSLPVYVMDGPLAVNGRPANIMPVPNPQFIVRQCVACMNLWDDQTLVFYDRQPLPMAPKMEPRTGRLLYQAGNSRKHLLVLATVSLVDAAGNRLHTEEEMPFARDQVPLQPPHPTPTQSSTETLLRNFGGKAGGFPSHHPATVGNPAPVMVDPVFY